MRSWIRNRVNVPRGSAAMYDPTTEYARSSARGSALIGVWTSPIENLCFASRVSASQPADSCCPPRRTSRTRFAYLFSDEPAIDPLQAVLEFQAVELPGEP
jgi:hypothetical protein